MVRKKMVVLPMMPRNLLSQQQRLVYEMSSEYSTKEISQITAIPEKQVRQVFSAIRQKWKKYANESVLNSIGGKSAHFTYHDVIENNSMIDKLLGEKCISFTAAELFVLAHVSRGFSIKEIAKLSHKSEQAIRKIQQRLKKKLLGSLLFNNKTVIKIDTQKEMVKIDSKALVGAIHRSGMTHQDIYKKTGIRTDSIKGMMESGYTSYHNLFLLMGCLDFKPYGSSEKEDLVQRIDDPNWLALIRSRAAECEGKGQARTKLSRIARDKARYRNQVMYYGNASLRHNGNSPEVPTLENGRNGLFPLVLTKQQQKECGWLLKKLMLRPVYIYKCPGLAEEIKLLEKKILKAEEVQKIEKYKRELLLLKENADLEDGKAVFIIRKDHFVEINRVLGKN